MPEFLIKFENVDLASAGLKIARLKNELQEVSKDVTLKVVKEDPNTQDMGAILVMVLGTPAIVSIANGIANFLMRTTGTLEIEKDGKIIAKNIKGSDLAKIVEALSHKE